MTRGFTPLLILGLAATSPAQSTLATYVGDSFDDRLSLSAGGRDLDGDGVDDFLLATPHDGQDAGVVTAYSGASGGEIWTLQGGAGDRLGHALVLVDDLTLDGVADVIVGAPGATEPMGSSPGAVRVVSGSLGTVVSEYFGFADGGEMGYAVAGGFDWDRDGVDDFAGGQPVPSPNLNGYEIWSGATGLSLIQASTVAPVRLGHALAGVGDVDQDGFGDLAVGYPHWGGNAGEMRVVTQGQILLEVSGVAGQLFGWTIEAATDLNLDGSADFLVGAIGGGGSGQVDLIDGATGNSLDCWFGNAPFDQFGISIARVGDVNADGVPDFAVGAPQPQGFGPGYARVISLRFGTELWTVTGTAVNQEVGRHVGAVGDVNDDGVPDVGIGAPGTHQFGFPIKLNAGRVTIYSGGCPGFVNYCTPGTSASGCNARISGSGTPSWFAPSGFTLSAFKVEGDKSALFFFGWNGRQANSWGNGTSYQCVVPPVKRGGVLAKNGTAGKCNGTYSQDLNALWAANPNKNPGPGTVVQAQLWHRDPGNTSNQTTSFSDAIEFVVCQ